MLNSHPMCSTCKQMTWNSVNDLKKPRKQGPNTCAMYKYCTCTCTCTLQLMYMYNVYSLQLGLPGNYGGYQKQDIPMPLDYSKPAPQPPRSHYWLSSIVHQSLRLLGPGNCQSTISQHCQASSKNQYSTHSMWWHRMLVCISSMHDVLYTVWATHSGKVQQ